MTAPSPMKSALVLAVAGLHPSAPVNELLVEDVHYFTDGWRQPCYYDAARGAVYQIGGVPKATPATADTGAGATFAAGAVVVYRVTSYNSRIDVETPPKEYTHTVGGAPTNITHTFTDPSVVDPQYDKVRFYRQLPGGNFKLAGDVAGNSSPWIDSVTNTTLEGNAAMVVRRRTTLPPKFRGWIFAQGRIIAWTGLDAILRFSQLRSVGGTGNVLTDFPDDLILPVEPNDGFGAIVSVAFDGEAFYVFKERAVYRLYGGPDPIDFDLEITCAEIGCLAQHSVVRIKSVLFWLSNSAVMMLTPGGVPQVVAQVDDDGASPLEPIWERVNRRALHYVRAWHDVRRGRYVLRVPLDDDPLAHDAAILEYRVPGERFAAVDEEVYVACSATVNDGGGVVHALGLDDLGHVLELEYGTNDLLPSGVSPDGSGVSGDSRTLSSGGVFQSGMLGVPFEVRQSDGVTLVAKNRVYDATSGGNVQCLYYMAISPPAFTDPADGYKVKVGTIESYFQGPDFDFGDARVEKELLDVGIEHGVQATGSLEVSVVENRGQSTLVLASMPMNSSAGSTFTHGKGSRGVHLSLLVRNSDPDVPWSVNSYDLRLAQGRDRR